MNNAFRSILLSTLVISLGTGITQAQPQTTLNPIPENPALTVEEMQQMTGGPQRVVYVKQDGELSEAISYWYYKAGLDGERVPLQLSNLPVELQSPHKTPINWFQVPFWKAAQDIEELTGLRWSSRLETGSLLVPAGASYAGDLSGPLAAETPFAKITAQLGRPPLPKNVEGKLNPALALSLYLDPQLKIESGSFSIDYAEYEAGKPVFPFPQREAFGPGFTGSQLISKFNVMLPKTAKIGTKISRLGGGVRAYLITVKQTLKVEDLSKAVGTVSQVGNVDFKVLGATVEGRFLKVKLAAERPELESQFPNPAVAFADARVRDAQGHLLGSMPTNLRVFKAVQGREKLEGEISFSLADGQGPFSLEWTLPTRTRRLEIPFELKDLVLR